MSGIARFRAVYGPGEGSKGPVTDQDVHPAGWLQPAHRQAGTKRIPVLVPRQLQTPEFVGIGSEGTKTVHVIAGDHGRPSKRDEKTRKNSPTEAIVSKIASAVKRNKRLLMP